MRCFLVISLLLSLLTTAGNGGAPLQSDIKLWQVVSPADGNTPDCLNNNNVPVTVIYENVGIDTLYNIPISYKVDNGLVITDTIPYAETGLFHLFTFAVPVDISALPGHTITCWTSLANDMDLTNDTTESIVILVAGTLLQLPFFENFESLPNCDTTANCGTGICMTGTKWKNEINSSADGIDFRVNSGTTPTDLTGPDVDHTIGDSTGKYIYLESSNCDNQTALFTSECIDLTNATIPELRFRYHMYGSGMGSLGIQIYSHGRWYSNQIPLLSGDMGNQWYEQPLSLTHYIGDVILVQFMAITGADSTGTSDMAIDDILVSEPGVPPLALFTADTTTGCAGKIVEFTDLTAYLPLTWQWTISPSTFTYLNGTDSLTQNPIIQFNAVADYTVKLNVTNYFGKDSITFTNYITIHQPVSLPITEDFESGTFPPEDWTSSVSNEYDWDSLTVTGSNGLSTVAAWSNNFNNHATFTEDILGTFPIDLTGVISPLLTFDVSYAWYDTINIDGLRIEISTDCGVSYVPTGYLKTDSILATVPAQLTEFFPTQASHWRNDSVLLSNWPVSEVILKFINMNGFGNNLFIDNINIQSIVSVEEQHPEILVNTYPNPTRNDLFLEMDIPGSEMMLIEILDFQGRLLHSEKLMVNNKLLKQFSLGKYVPGIYFIRVSSAKSSTLARIMLVD